MAHARVIAVGIGVAAAGIGKGGSAVHMLLTSGNLNIQVLGIVDVVGRVDVDTANRINKRLHAVKADLGIVRNLHAAQLVDRLDHGLGAAMRMTGVNLHGLALVHDLGIARNGDKRCLLFRRVNASQDNRVGTIRILARTTVGTKKQHVERIFCLIGIDQNLAQVVGNDIGVAKLAHDSGKPQTRSSRGAQQHAEYGDESYAANRAAATALTGALGIACDIVATVDLGLRTSRGSSGVIR